MGLRRSQHPLSTQARTHRRRRAHLKLKWAFAFAGDSVRSAQPAVVGGRVFTGSASGAVYSLDAATGCIYWKYDAGAMVRTAISIGQAGGKTIA